ncbi:MarR family transcriptional regulator [Ralstonia insidiosa]|uniref:MarR family transcriptional regulator n=1 Tax=Ralstonia insidiosa TaxID=190721 RepID=A0A192A631_9RALS|nr:MarR family transcriptional regulator [Ralstonia insidiosa]ANJ75798.1 MarR family transcriptional regulator [Ralstonia insidiosa]KAB0469399.1 MarR family transcriptional regulator [Ralstonia insidiosa]MBY4910081.1 MarR family transcriptional regulator [Ralstonia insidiosa]
MSKPRKTALATRTSGYHKVVQALGDERIGLEARAHVDDHIDVKIWLRLLACSTQIEQQIRQRLRTRFNTTLPRFDYLAQLDRYPDGMRMNVLSRYLMVTGGNVTGLTDQLEKEGLVKREPDPDDRRSFRVSLTDAGRRNFAEMAAEHERWLIEMFDGLGVSNKDALYAQLGRLRMHLAEREAELDAREDQP